MVNTMYVGIIGFGGEGNSHRINIERIDGLKVAGIYDIKDCRNKFALDNGINIYENFDAMLADDKIDIILIATPNDLHKSMAISALRAGKNVICEKPVTLSSDELSEILDEEKKSGKIFSVFQNRRWDKDYLAMKQLYESGELGDVHRIEHRVHGSRGIPGDWRQYPEFGGGMILDWGVHILDQMALLVDEKIKSVYCSIDNVTNELVDDGFNIRLKFESGVEAVLEVGTSNFITLPMWYMLGRNGSAVIRGWDVNDNEIVIADELDNTDIVPVITASGITKTMAPRKPEQYKSGKLEIPESNIDDFYYNFMDACNGKADQYIKNDQVMRIMKLMEAAFESAKDNKVVYFE